MCACVKSAWIVKRMCSHQKICIYHYNSDIAQYPSKRKRHRDNDDDEYVPNETLMKKKAEDSSFGK